MKEAIIFFTKVPIPGIVKTRLLDFLNEEQATILQKKLIAKNLEIIKSTGIDLFIYCTPFDKLFILEEFIGANNYSPQSDGDLGDKMFNAFKEIFNKGYAKVILLGSDIVDLTREMLFLSFKKLDEYDIIISPADDGGYCTIGMKKAENIFKIDSYGDSTVLGNTINRAKNLGLSVYTTETLLDIDTKDDLIKYYLNKDEVELFADRECNIDYKFKDGNGYKILRINKAKKSKLDKQSRYEFDCLKFLERTEITPKVYDLDDSMAVIPYEMLTMEFLSGRHLEYDNDLAKAAFLMATIHNLEIPLEHNFIEIKQAFKSIYEECEEMFAHYKSHSNRDEKIVEYIELFMNTAYNLGLDDVIQNRSIINRKLNAESFIIGDSVYDSYIVDWGKVVIGEGEEDLARFLAPTSTFWKSDKILNTDEINYFIEEYEKYSRVNIELLNKYILFTCLENITSCSRAYVEYIETGRNILDNAEFKKIRECLSLEFLEKIKQNIFL